MVPTTLLTIKEITAKIQTVLTVLMNIEQMGGNYVSIGLYGS